MQNRATINSNRGRRIASGLLFFDYPLFNVGVVPNADREGRSLSEAAGAGGQRKLRNFLRCSMDAGWNNARKNMGAREQGPRYR